MMNRQELANLLSQTQSMIAGPSLSHQSTMPVSRPPLSPRQRFQSQVRTLSDRPPSPTLNASITPQTSPQLRRLSSLRVQRIESTSPTRSDRETWRLSEEPQFAREEREVWGRQSPFRQSNSFPTGLLEGQTPPRYSSHEHSALRPFAPLLQSVDINDRPKTSRGLKADLEENEEQDSQKRPSKFAEGSMNARSAGISSSWHENASLTSCSESETSDTDVTPRASPNRSSIDIREFEPLPVTATTFAQRLFKFGTKAKTKDSSRQIPDKIDPDGHTVRKRKGLRKSMSVWNLHGDKKKAASQVDLNSASPQKNSALFAQASDLEVLNDRKRRAEEAYAQQFGMKKRKSNVGIPTSDDHSPEKPASAARAQTPTKEAPNSTRRRMSWSSTSTAVPSVETLVGVNNIDLQKRPSRRELEKQNQQLRDLLRQQQETARLTAKVFQPESPPFKAASKAPVNVRDTEAAPPAKPSTRKQSRERLPSAVPPVPPVPSPERVALKPLSNTTNIPQKRPSQENLKTFVEDGPERGRPLTSEQPGKATAKFSRRASIARGVELPRSVSIILEQDEEFEAERKKKDKKEDAVKENIHPFQDIPKLQPTPMAGLSRCDVVEDTGSGKIGGDNVVQARSVRRENWEWPDDVF